MKILSILPLLVSLGLPFHILAQDRPLRTLQWMDKAPPSSGKGGEVKGEQGAKGPLNFGTSGSVVLADAWLDMERGGLPVWHESVPLPAGTSGISVTLVDATYEPVPAELLKLLPELRNVPREPVITTSVALERKRPFGQVDIEPFRMNPATGQVERLLSFRMDMVRTSAGPAARPKSYPATSKLASGEWYRFSVAADGVYKVSYENLQAMGVNVNGLSSAVSMSMAIISGFFPSRTMWCAPRTCWSMRSKWWTVGMAPWARTTTCFSMPPGPSVGTDKGTISGIPRTSTAIPPPTSSVSMWNPRSVSVRPPCQRTPPHPRSPHSTTDNSSSGTW